MLQIISKGIEKIERYWQCWSCCCGTGPRKQACFLPLRRTWSNQCRQLSIFIISYSYFNYYKKPVLLHMWPSSYSYSQLFNPVLSWHSPCLESWICKVAPEWRSREARVAPSRARTITWDFKSKIICQQPIQNLT